MDTDQQQALADANAALIEVRAYLEEFFHNDPEKIGRWMTTPNPMFGDVAPVYLVACGRWQVVLDFVRDAREANAAAPYEVTCARCGKAGTSAEFVIEEGDEWECPACNARENARERQTP